MPSIFSIMFVSNLFIHTYSAGLGVVRILARVICFNQLEGKLLWEGVRFFWVVGSTGRWCRCPPIQPPTLFFARKPLLRIPSPHPPPYHPSRSIVAGFVAPSVDGAKADIWSFGVTVYCGPSLSEGLGDRGLGSSPAANLKPSEQEVQRQTSHPPRGKILPHPSNFLFRGLSSWFSRHTWSPQPVGG